MGADRIEVAVADGRVGVKMAVVFGTLPTRMGMTMMQIASAAQASTGSLSIPASISRVPPFPARRLLVSQSTSISTSFRKANTMESPPPNKALQLTGLAGLLSGLVV